MPCLAWSWFLAMACLPSSKILLCEHDYCSYFFRLLKRHNEMTRRHFQKKRQPQVIEKLWSYCDYGNISSRCSCNYFRKTFQKYKKKNPGSINLINFDWKKLLLPPHSDLDIILITLLKPIETLGHTSSSKHSSKNGLKYVFPIMFLQYTYL